MLYTTKSGEQTLQIPRNVSDMPQGAYRLTLRSTIELKFYEIPISDVSETMLLINCNVNLPELTEGEYEYTLFKGGKTIGEGLLIVGYYTAETKAFNTEIKYTQYE